LIAANKDGIAGIGMPEYNPVTGEYNFFLTIYGNTIEEEMTFYLTDKAGQVLAIIEETTKMSDNKVFGSLTNPYVLHLTSDKAEEESASMVYPNPFSSSAYLEVWLNKPELVQAIVFNAAGQRIAIIQNGMLEMGAHVLSWNGKTSQGHSATPGLYYLRVNIGGELKSHKIIKE